MITPVYTASPFTIQEQTGLRRNLRLVGRALPYRPFNLKTTQRVELTWYPGNPEATATILGAAEEPTQIRGAWKDKYIASSVEATALTPGEDLRVLIYPITLNDEPIVDVRNAVSVVDDIIRAGQQLLVTWDDQTRVGHLTEFDKNWNNYHDLEWSMSFEWISRGEPIGSALFTTSVSLSDVSGTISAQSANFRSAIDSITTPPSPELVTALTDIADSNENSVIAILSAINNTVSQVQRDATRAVTRAITVCSQIIDQAEATIETMQSVVNGAYDSAVALSEMDFQRRLEWAAYNNRVVSAAKSMRTNAVQQRAALSKQAESTLLAIYTAREGDDLRTVSEQFYGSPFDWRSLLIYNELTSSELRAGQVILVPRKPGQRK